MEQFLSRLPQSVIKEGKIIDVRSGVANVIKVCNLIDLSLFDRILLKYTCMKMAYCSLSNSVFPLGTFVYFSIERIRIAFKQTSDSS